MRPYDPSIWTDEALIAEIKQYQAAKKEAALGGGVGKVQGEGRLVEFTRANSSEIDLALRELYAEMRRRGLGASQGYGGAIAVEIG
jgi:hypothetical protein